MPKKKQVLPSKIQVKDEHGQRWDIDSDDALWEKALKLTKNGTQDAEIPLATIIANRGWGWWSCFKTQDEWLAGVGIPMPSQNLLDNAADVGLASLGERLQEYGSYLSYLEAQVGAIAGRRNALRQVFDAAIMVSIADFGEGTNKSKEAQALAESETLRENKRRLIETDMLYETAWGMCKGYQRAWETVSRLITIKTSEMELQPRRTH